MAAFVQPVRRCQPRRPAADDGYFFAGTDRRNLRFHQTMGKSVFNQIEFVVLNGNGFSVNAVDTGFFTQGRTDSSGEFREGVHPNEPLQSMSVDSPIDGIVPFRDEIV